MHPAFSVKVFPTKVARVRGSLTFFLMSGKVPLPTKILSTQITKEGTFFWHCENHSTSFNVVHVGGKVSKGLAAFFTGVIL